MPRPCAVDTTREQSRAEIERDAAALAELVHAARHVVVFTGAGISTSAAIPDFRGPNGVWTCRDAGRAAPECIALEQAIPTPCHRTIQRLVARGDFKYVVSQNVDGLHRRSGVPRDRLSELHGNSFLDVCWGCGADNEHTTQVPSGANGNARCATCLERVPHFCHCTGEACRQCGGPLRDSIIHFGENLPEQALNRAYRHARRADVCVVLGSSLTVSPANEIPKIVADRGGKLIIVNLQPTDLDDRACLRVFARTDEFSELFERRLNALKNSDAAESAAAETASLASTRTVAHAVAPPPRAFALCNTATSSTRHADYYDWAVFVAGVGRDGRLQHHPEGVRRVTYKLHPTFPEPEVTVDASPENPAFASTHCGWGTFVVAAAVELEDGRVANVRHELSFDPGCHASAPATAEARA